MGDALFGTQSGIRSDMQFKVPFQNPHALEGSYILYAAPEANSQ